MLESEKDQVDSGRHGSSRRKCKTGRSLQKKVEVAFVVFSSSVTTSVCVYFFRKN